VEEHYKKAFKTGILKSKDNKINTTGIKYMDKSQTAV